MFERLTVPARQAISEAKEIARSAGSDEIAPTHLLVGLARGEHCVAGRLLDARVELAAIESAFRSLPRRTFGGLSEDLHAVMAAAVGVAAARGERRVGTASFLLALLALEPPGLLALLDTLGVDPAELAAVARTADDSCEGDTLTATTFGGERVEPGQWAVTVGTADPAIAWSDKQA
jgi:ATP-dependent Clp protease ATP-binding subunit ClpA